MSPDHGGPHEEERIPLSDGRKVPFWLRPKAGQRHYRGVARYEASEQAELAELAEMVALEAGPIGPHRNTDKNAGVYGQGAHLYGAVREAVAAGADELEAMEEAAEADRVLRDAGSAALQAYAHMPAVEKVIRRYHPDFDHKPPRDRIELLIQSVRHMDQAWWALDALREFAQGGRLEGRSRRKSADPLLDLRAAELRDALGLPYREIGVILSIPLSRSDKDKGSHRTVSNMVRRGRAKLIERLGEGGYHENIEDVRRWHELDDRQRILQRMIEITAGLAGRPLEEVEAMRPRFERWVNEHFPDQPRT